MVNISADDNLNFLLLFFPEKRTWHFMQIVFKVNNLHEMSNNIFFLLLEKI